MLCSCFLLPCKYHVSRFTTWVGLHSLLKLSLQPTGGICVFKMCKNSWMQLINKHWHMVQLPVQQSYLYPLDWQFPKLLGPKYKVSPPKQQLNFESLWSTIKITLIPWNPMKSLFVEFVKPSIFAVRPFSSGLKVTLNFSWVLSSGSTSARP